MIHSDEKERAAGERSHQPAAAFRIDFPAGPTADALNPLTPAKR